MIVISVGLCPGSPEGAYVASVEVNMSCDRQEPSEIFSEWEVVCAGTGAAGTSAAVWAVRTHISGTSPKLVRLWATVSVTPAAHQHINGI